ncbi:M3 family oligoendopeptidase [Bacillus sp. HMF5848]|uniref:M3 family oligoendopeptidase n=1 Tax=Bacillus sp. HMF5848 TaxID=2495421 RepID=UPI000F7952CC|nr:M3 family oligoendopeptidase [Bacillus sp. HMF5848]RSK26723.1 M3 family oligoendopeptidase [Bacillus sp. HMF5848]
MKFEQFEYVRPIQEDFEESYQSALEEFDQAKSFEQQNHVMEKINSLRKNIRTMDDLCYVRHTIDTNNEFYKTERDYMDDFYAVSKKWDTRFYKALVSSKFRKELEEKWGAQLFAIADSELKTFNDDVFADLQKENKLSSQYTKLVAAAKIDFDGKELTLEQLQPYTESTDRNIRKAAREAYFGYFSAHEEDFDRIYDVLVSIRTSIAKKLGYENFVQLGYYRMNRTDYNAEMVKVFREQVKTHIVPIATKLYESQRERIGVNELTYYDEPLKFLTGNANPKGDPEWIIEKGKKMYKELSSETNEFFTFMIEKNLLDLVAKPGKANGGYCTLIENYKAPFIFSNFNGTNGDITVLTHEAGHAFQAYKSTVYDVPEYHFPTSEAAEIHSMSMEFFTWPWMKEFFEDDTNKFLYDHMAGSLLFIPYGVAVDEFQHFVYENPSATPAERKQAWREIESVYLPHRNYDGFAYLENGGFWQRQLHIYNYPFYYIDYCLAQICALQFWKRTQQEDPRAWDDYVSLCKLGGSKSFLKLVEHANLQSPFEEVTVASIVGEIESWLNSINDKSL